MVVERSGKIQKYEIYIKVKKNQVFRSLMYLKKKLTLNIIENILRYFNFLKLENVVLLLY